MKITTRQNELIEVDDNQIVTFPEGLVGFEEYTEYALFSVEAEEPFYRLQYLKAGDVAFVVVDPLLIDPDYDFEVDDETIDLLDIQNPETLRLYVIVTVHSDFHKMTANMLAPILLNEDNNTARQLVLHDSSYTTREPVFSDAGEDEEA